MHYESTVEIGSTVCPVVRYSIRRMSFGRRLELTRAVQQAVSKMRFLSAGEPDRANETEAALLAGEVDREYLRWGLAGVSGLEIDGEPATTESLIEAGPEDLLREALEAVRREMGLTEEERKNSSSHSTSHAREIPAGSATTAAAWGSSGSGRADG